MRPSAAYAAALLALVPAEARAYRLSVVAASEVQLEPEVRAGATALAVRVRLRDDRGAALAGRRVMLTFGAAGIADLERRVETDANGAGVASVEVGPARVLRVEGRFVGDSTAAPARASIVVDLDAPFVTPELVVPGEGVELGAPPFEAVVTVRVGQVQALSPGRLGVEVTQSLDGSGRRRALAAGETDAAGRAALTIPTARFDGVGVARLVPRVDLGGGRVVEGTARDLLVRGRTALSLLRAPRGDEESDAVTVHGALLLPGGAPVPGAAVRIVRGERTVAAARTDARGLFTLTLGAESLAEAGVVVRAVFEPTEPWYIGAESPPLALTEPAPPPIRWTWAAVPLGLAALATAFISLRRKRSDAPAPAVRPSATDHVERLDAAPATPDALRVLFMPVDRATGAAVAGARVRVADGAWRDCAEGAVDLAGARSLTATLEADGFAPRELTLDLPRAGAYRVQVAMRTWREELFARARPWLAADVPGVAPRTPRELARAAPGPVAALATHVERGCYGPDAPGPEALATADDLTRAVRDDASSSRPDRR